MTSEKHGWKKLSAETVYDNPWIRVENHDVINPAGGKSQYGKICFKNLAVAILAADQDNNIYLVGQYRYTLDEYSWELPMGGAPLTEDPLMAAKRELREETGLTAAHWVEVMRLHPSNSVSDEKGIVYLARDLSLGDPEPEDTEVLAIKKIPLSGAFSWTREGKITDAISVAAILRLAADSASLLA
ncbi:MAG: NUDIX domain-containing protein [Gammaproteobacteria bacterium]